MKRLVELRKFKNVTQDEVAAYLEVSRPTYTRYETGDREPDYDTLQKLADYFQCTTDFLLGRDSDNDFEDVENDYSWLNDLGSEDIVERIFKDFGVLFSLSSKATPEQLKGVYIDLSKRLNR